MPSLPRPWRSTARHHWRKCSLGVPAVAISTVDEVLTLPHTPHRQMVVELDGYRGVGPPVKMSGTLSPVRLPPPAFAQHRDEILREAGRDSTSTSLSKVAQFKGRED